MPTPIPQPAPFAGAGDLQPMAWPNGAWFMLPLAVLTAACIATSILMRVGLASSHHELARVVLAAEPFLVGALFGANVMFLIHRRARRTGTPSDLLG